MVYKNIINHVVHIYNAFYFIFFFFLLFFFFHETTTVMEWIVWECTFRSHVDPSLLLLAGTSSTVLCWHQSPINLVFSTSRDGTSIHSFSGKHVPVYCKNILPYFPLIVFFNYWKGAVMTAKQKWRWKQEYVWGF